MIVTHNITIDLLDKGAVPQVDATQDDQYTRNLAIALMEGETPWTIPEDSAAVIRYCKGDGVGGEYDTLPDGTAAWWAEGNVLTLALAPQVLTCPGTVMLSASLIREEEVISIFSIAISVRPQVRGIFAESAPYYNVAGFLPGPVNAKPGQYLRIAGVNEEGRVVALEGADGPTGGTAASLEPEKGEIPRVFFGGALPQTKTDVVMPWRYVSKTMDISGWCKTKAQGNSSMKYPKKNQTVKLYADEACKEKQKLDFFGWGSQSKHCYKANWIDLTHARNVVSARLWADVVKSRADYESLPELLRTSPNQGAVDGFPVKVFADGIYLGRYTINIPKDPWMANMDESLDNHCILCGENYVSGCFRGAANINGADWTDEVHDSVPAAIKSRWNEVISFVMNATDAEFYARLGDYFYVDSLIDYHLFGLISCGLDAYGKNQIYMTYDGQKWIASMYDMDATWGLWWDGSTFVATDYDRSEYQDFKDGSGNLLYIRLEQCFFRELQSRWEELKCGVLSREHIMNRFEEFVELAPQELVKEDYAGTTGVGAFTAIPSKTTNHIQQLRSFIRARHAWCDGYVAALEQTEAVPCTGITLSDSAVTLDGGGFVTVTAAVTPENCTDTISWTSSNTAAATVKSGVITAVANGTAVVTASCGGYAASVTVTVNNMIISVPCTGISLSANALTFTDTASRTLTAVTTPDGCTDVVTWESSDSAVAAVADGVVTPTGNGNAVITAYCGAYSASCEVSVSAFTEEPALYPLENGTCSFTEGTAGACDITLTVSGGNHVNLQTVTAGGNLNVNIGALSENSTSVYDKATNINNKPMMFPLTAGDVIRTVVTLSGLHTCATAFSVFLVKANATSTKDIFSGKASAEQTLTLTEDIDVGAIGMWVGTSVSVVDFDLKVYVNGVRYI